jgi:cobyrinic acid a,c-diamide synthase
MPRSSQAHVYPLTRTRDVSGRLPFAGVLANRVASTAHLGMLKASVPAG